MNRTTERELARAQSNQKALMVFILILVVVPEFIWRGYVLSKLWAWFIVTKFNAPPIGIASAIALSLFVGFLLPHQKLKTDGKPFSDLFSEAIAMAIFRPAMALLFGWILTHFV